MWFVGLAAWNAGDLFVADECGTNVDAVVSGRSSVAAKKNQLMEDALRNLNQELKFRPYKHHLNLMWMGCGLDCRWSC